MNLEIFLKSYGFLSLAKKIGNNLTGKYGQELFDSAKKLAATKIAADALKTPSKRATQTTPEATGDFIYNKIADKKTNMSSQNVLKTNSLNRLNTTLQTENVTPKEIYIPPKKDSNLLMSLG